MNRVMITGLVAIAGAVAISAPAQSDTAMFGLTRKAAESADIRRTDEAPVACRVATRWSYDYEGNLYLKKKRVCA